MRVIAGQYKSRPLKTLTGLNTRPTSDRLRETLFNVLTARDPQALEGSVWIDLFAGTGAVGIEALSRGASQVTFVDNSKAATQVIRENVQSLGIAKEVVVVEGEAVKALRQLKKNGATVDYVFIDPPYADEGAYADTLAALGVSSVLRVNAVVVVEHDKRFDPGEEFGGLKRYRKLAQGDSGLSFYGRTDS